MNIFKSSSKTSKEYIIQKRNLNIYKDLSNNSSNSLAKTNSTKITKVLNHSSRINLNHGFFDYQQNDKCKNATLLSTYNPQIFRRKPQPYLTNDYVKNTDVSHNYIGMRLTMPPNQSSNNNQNSSILHSSEANIIQYTNVVRTNNATLKSQKKSTTTKCYKINTNNITIE
tara:strand:- start:3076 stop:3585 length:510 start_codon:yes stop_codon:yes gene_type:complete